MFVQCKFILQYNSNAPNVIQLQSVDLPGQYLTQGDIIGTGEGVQAVGVTVKSVTTDSQKNWFVNS